MPWLQNFWKFFPVMGERKSNSTNPMKKVSMCVVGMTWPESGGRGSHSLFNFFHFHSVLAIIYQNNRLVHRLGTRWTLCWKSWTRQCTLILTLKLYSNLFTVITWMNQSKRSIWWVTVVRWKWIPALIMLERGENCSVCLYENCRLNVQRRIDITFTWHTAHLIKRTSSVSLPIWITLLGTLVWWLDGSI